MVETIRLESGHTLTGIGGSNPSLSAMFSSTYKIRDPLCNPLIRLMRCQCQSNDLGMCLRHLIRDHIPIQVHRRADVAVPH